jgi:hypothetical protein
MFDPFNHQERARKMAEISPRARAAVMRETYRLDLVTDDVGIPQIIEELFLLVVEDMFYAGIEFRCSPAELMGSYIDLDGFLEVARLLLPGSLCDQIRKDPVVGKVLLNILDMPDSEDDPVVSYLNWLGHDDDRYREDLEFATGRLLNWVHSDGTFPEYIRGVIALSQMEDRLGRIDVDDELVLHFTSYIVSMDDRFQAGLKAVVDVGTQSFQFDVLAARIRNYTPYLTKSDTFGRNALLFLGNRAQLSESVDIPGWLTRLRSGYPLFPEYFTLQEKKITTTDALGIYLRIFSTAVDADAFVTEARAAYNAMQESGIYLADGPTITAAMRKLRDTFPNGGRA